MSARAGPEETGLRPWGQHDPALSSLGTYD